MQGRPTVYSEAVAIEIYRLLIEGWSLRRICREEDQPGLSTVTNWLATPGHPFLEHYTRAREIQAELNADEIIDIADGLDGGSVIERRLKGRGDDAVEEVYLDNQATRNRIEARKWTASKLLPKKYGEKLDVTSGDEPIGALPDVLLGPLLKAYGESVNSDSA